MSDLTELGNMALRSVIARVGKELCRDDWTLGFYRGQVSLIGCYMTPDAELLKAAGIAVDGLIIGKQNKEPT